MFSILFLILSHDLSMIKILSHDLSMIKKLHFFISSRERVDKSKVLVTLQTLILQYHVNIFCYTNQEMLKERFL